VARTAVREGRGGSAAAAAAAADFSDEAALAPVLDNSLGWAAFMGTSANVRYQLVNAIEERFLVRAPAPRACRPHCGRVCLLRACVPAAGVCACSIGTFCLVRSRAALKRCVPCLVHAMRICLVVPQSAVRRAPLLPSDCGVHVQRWSRDRCYPL